MMVAGNDYGNVDANARGWYGENLQAAAEQARIIQNAQAQAAANARAQASEAAQNRMFQFQTGPQFDWEKQKAAQEMGLRGDELGFRNRELDWRISEPSAADIRDKEFKFQAIQSLATAGHKIPDEALSTLTDAEKAVVNARFDEARRQKQTEFQQAQGIADMLNEKQDLDFSIAHDPAVTKPWFSGMRDASVQQPYIDYEKKKARQTAIGNALAGVNKALLNFVHLNPASGKWESLLENPSGTSATPPPPPPPPPVMPPVAPRPTFFPSMPFNPPAPSFGQPATVSSSTGGVVRFRTPLGKTGRIPRGDMGLMPAGTVFSE